MSKDFFYLCREIKGADQLPGYPAADSHLCFHICVAPAHWSFERLMGCMVPLCKAA